MDRGETGLLGNAMLPRMVDVIFVDCIHLASSGSGAG